MGAARQAARNRAGIRPPGQHWQRYRTAARPGYVGARLLPAIRERQGRMGEGLLEDRQLGGRSPAVAEGPHPRPGTIDDGASIVENVSDLGESDKFLKMAGRHTIRFSIDLMGSG